MGKRRGVEEEGKRRKHNFRVCYMIYIVEILRLSNFLRDVKKVISYI